MKRILLGISALLCIAGTALAGPISLPSNTPIFIQFINLEQVSLGNNIVINDAGGVVNGGLPQGNWGVVEVTSIQLGSILIDHSLIQGGTTHIFDSGAAGQITGIFYGIQVDPSGVTARGGTLDLYWNDFGVNTVGAMNTYLPNGATATAFSTGTLLASINFATGIIPGDSTTTIESTVNPTTVTSTGQADSFGNVDLTKAGVWNTSLNGDWFWVNPTGTAIETRDIRFSNIFFGYDAWDGPAGTGIQGLGSNDPARVLTAVPEPGTLVLLGLGLLGLGFSRRRK